MRNVDQIKELQKQLKEAKNRIKDQEDTIKVLRNQNDGLNYQKLSWVKRYDDLKKASAEVQKAMNAVMIAVIEDYGLREVEDGYLTIRIRKPDVKKTDEYDVITDMDGDTRIIKAAPKEADDGSDKE